VPISEWVIQQHRERKRRYLEFLRSPEWRATSTRVKEKAHYLCAVCATSDDLHVHHDLDDFPQPNRPEAPADLPAGWLPQNDVGLVCLCAYCHAAAHHMWRWGRHANGALLH
jgi:5-methylcytosine-specific restriction endonuclease McrA